MKKLHRNLIIIGVLILFVFLLSYAANMGYRVGYSDGYHISRQICDIELLVK